MKQPGEETEKQYGTWGLTNMNHCLEEQHTGVPGCEFKPHIVRGAYFKDR